MGGVVRTKEGGKAMIGFNYIREFIFIFFKAKLQTKMTSNILSKIAMLKETFYMCGKRN